MMINQRIVKDDIIVQRSLKNYLVVIGGEFFTIWMIFGCLIMKSAFG